MSTLDLTPQVTVAHPVTDHPHVDVPVVLVAALVALAVLLALLLAPSRTGDDAAPRRPAAGSASWESSLSPSQVVVRVAATLLLAAAVVAGRFGSPDELENLAPALVVGAGWPLLVLVCLVLPAWRWVDPWDSIARLVAPGDRSEPGAQAWPAVVVAAGWLWFVAVHQRPLDPRAVGLVLLAYTTLTVAGCLVRGRRRWLSTTEPVGLGLTWLTAAARGRLDVATLPRGAGTLVGVTLGGVLFGALRRTEPWSGIGARPDATWWATGAFLACLALGAALVALGLVAGRRWHDRGAVLLGLLPATAGLVLAFALARNRLTTSLQLIPDLLGDPLGRGWDLLGPAGQGLDAAPFGAAGLVAVQLAVLAAGFVWGAVVASRGTTRSARVPAAVVLPYVAALCVVVVSLH